MCARLRHRQEMDKENRTAPTSRVNYCHLTSPEKNQRLLRLHTSLRAANRQVTRLRERVEAATAACGEVLDEEIHCDLQQIMEENSPAILHKHSPESFAGVFWAQQQAAAKCSTSSSMRWHPLMIKWCLIIRHLSSHAYETLRTSGCLTLPSQRTLRDYTHYADIKSGFSVEVDRQLIDAAQIRTSDERRKCVVLLLDEMHIREDLVFDKTSGMMQLSR